MTAVIGLCGTLLTLDAPQQPRVVCGWALRAILEQPETISDLVKRWLDAWCQVTQGHARYRWSDTHAWGPGCEAAF